MQIDVRGSEQLQAVIAALKDSDAATRRVIRTYTDSVIVRPWLEEVNNRASTTLERRVIAATATAKASDQNIRIESAARGAALSGGLQPARYYGPVEFGAGRKKSTYWRRDRGGGGRHTVTRNTRAQFRPPRRKGYVFYPAAEEMIPRLASLWVQTVVKLIADNFEGRK